MLVGLGGAKLGGRNFGESLVFVEGLHGAKIRLSAFFGRMWKTFAGCYYTYCFTQQCNKYLGALYAMMIFLTLGIALCQRKMKAEFYSPSPALLPFIRQFVIIQSNLGDDNRVLPDTSLVMAFRFCGEVNYTAEGLKKSLPVSVISGLRRSARLMQYQPKSGNLLVIFNETGAAAFFKPPVYELFNNSIAMEDIIGRQKMAAVEEQLAEAPDNARRIAIIESFLLTQAIHYKPDTLVLSALQKLRAGKGYIRIKDLAGSLCISQDAFEKRFRKATGASPKQFSSIIRMRQLISSAGQSGNLNQLAFNAGYFDQPHFNKDFKLFTGQTPGHFFRNPLFW
jgi:AraC-like DNA-binding protein